MPVSGDAVVPDTRKPFEMQLAKAMANALLALSARCVRLLADKGVDVAMTMN